MQPYKSTFRNNLKFIGLTIFIFCLPFVLFIALLITTYAETDQLKWVDSASKTSFFFLVTSAITIPGFLLHFKYYINSKNKSIYITQTYITITDEERTTKIFYDNLAKVEFHFMFRSIANPWKNYGYIKLFLKNGKTLSYNCLIYDKLSSLALFRSKQVQLEECDEIYPWQK